MIPLTAGDVKEVTLIGCARQLRRMGAGHQNAHGAQGGVELHIGGLLGELAFARLCGADIEARWWVEARKDIESDRDVLGTLIRTRTAHDHDMYLWLNDDGESWWAHMSIEAEGLREKQLLEALREGWRSGYVGALYHGMIHGQAAKVGEYLTRKGELGHGFPKEDCYIIPQVALVRYPSVPK